ncbi:hypothetical protein ABV409_12900 [Flagellimonas sp. DF-77]|uniref:hypothetical protein n=1 Tax=Flagellimonas algarum TaxID=3230298 RepID=UPI003391357A
MKKINFLLFTLFLICLTACSSGSSSNDDVDPVDDGPDQVDRSQNLLATGASANDILSNTNFDRIQVEIAFVEGFRPTAEAMTNFENFLRERTFKQQVDIDFLEIPSVGSTEITLQEIANLETENRTAYNNGNTIAIYIFFADASAEGDNLDSGVVTLGAVYRNTSMVIYERTVQALAGRSLTITDADVETATLNHEFGHLFGLVNLGTVPVNDHEDPNALNHCVIDGCLMQAELTFGSPSSRQAIGFGTQKIQSACSLSGLHIMNILESHAARGLAVVPDLDPECILDLQNNGGR